MLLTIVHQGEDIAEVAQSSAVWAASEAISEVAVAASVEAGAAVALAVAAQAQDGNGGKFNAASKRG